MSDIWFQYSGARSEGNYGRFYDRDYIRDGNLLIDNIRQEQREFDRHARYGYNDMQFYENLLAENGCTNVDISSIFVRYATPLVRYGAAQYLKYLCVAVGVVYRQTFRDGSCKYVRGPKNLSAGNLPWTLFSSKEHEFQLKRNEYLLGIRLHKGGTYKGATYLCGLTFVTNFREEHFGGHVCDQRKLCNAMASIPPDMRIVAFCGTHFGLICEHIGIYAKAFGWKSRGPYILMRRLVTDGRAEINGSTSSDASVRWLVNIDPGLFRLVMSYV